MAKKINSKRLYLYYLLSLFLPESRCFGLKNKMLRWCGATIGKDVRIYSSTKVHGTGTLIIGDDVFVGPNCILSVHGDAKLSIGSHVNIGAFSYITTGTHLVDPEGERSCGEGFNRDVIIDDGAWLTVHVYVLPGVMEQQLTIGKKAMIVGGSVIQSSVSPMAVMQGSPATQISVLRPRVRRRA